MLPVLNIPLLFFPSNIAHIPVGPILTLQTTLCPRPIIASGTDIHLEASIHRNYGAAERMCVISAIS